MYINKRVSIYHRLSSLWLQLSQQPAASLQGWTWEGTNQQTWLQTNWFMPFFPHLQSFPSHLDRLLELQKWENVHVHLRYLIWVYQKSQNSHRTLPFDTKSRRNYKWWLMWETEPGSPGWCKVTQFPELAGPCWPFSLTSPSKSTKKRKQDRGQELATGDVLVWH